MDNILVAREDTLERDVLAVALENLEDALAYYDHLEEDGEQPSESDERYLCHARADLASARLAKLRYWIDVASTQESTLEPMTNARLDELIVSMGVI